MVARRDRPPPGAERPCGAFGARRAVGAGRLLRPSTAADLLSIDVEGEGTAALESIDFEHTSIAVVLLEGNGLQQLERRGYYVVNLRTTHGDWLAWRPDLLRDRWNYPSP